jgi:L-iditol 2-dehydrogenase
MKTLVVERDGRITVHEVNKPRYNEYQALVKTIACGMCGTDIKLIHRTFKGFPESVYPIMLGHEGVGEVVEVGSKVKGLKVGDKVLLPFVDPDPENLPGLGSGWGALSEYAVVCDPKAPWPGGAPDCAFAQTVLDDDLDPVDATMIVTFREVLSNIRYFGIQPQDSVVVFGCGPVGLTYLKFMSLLGVKDLVACDILPEKLEQARNYGATHLINSKECDVRAEVRKLFPGGVDYVLDGRFPRHCKPGHGAYQGPWLSAVLRRARKGGGHHRLQPCRLQLARHLPADAPQARGRRGPRPGGRVDALR